MAKPFSELWTKMPGKSRQRARVQARVLLAAMPLQELRRARRMSQESLAKRLGATQASVSKLEHRADMNVSTLRNYVEALGGSLEIVARFPEGDIKLHRLGDTEPKRG